MERHSHGRNTDGEARGWVGSRHNESEEMCASTRAWDKNNKSYYPRLSQSQRAVQQQTKRIMVYGSTDDCESVQLPWGSEPFTIAYSTTNGPDLLKRMTADFTTVCKKAAVKVADLTHRQEVGEIGEDEQEPTEVILRRSQLWKWWMMEENESGCWRTEKRAAVVLSGGFTVKQWKALCEEVNKGN